VLGVTAKATDIEEGRAKLMMASSVISFLLIIKLKVNQILLSQHIKHTNSFV